VNQLERQGAARQVKPLERLGPRDAQRDDSKHSGKEDQVSL
jgi:hypothetical protein